MFKVWCEFIPLQQNLVGGGGDVCEFKKVFQKEFKFKKFNEKIKVKIYDLLLDTEGRFLFVYHKYC